MGDGSTAELGIPQKDLGIKSEPPVIKTPQPPIAPEKSRKQEIRKFSKSTPEGKHARQQTAQEVRQKRREPASKINLTPTSLERLDQVIDQKQAQLEQKRSRTLALLRQLEKRELSLVTRILDRVLPAAKSVIRRDIEKAALVKEYYQLSDTLRSLMEQKMSLRDPEDTLAEFYKSQLAKKEQADELEEYKERSGTVENVVKKYNVYFVHGTSPGIDRGVHNPFLKDRGITWQDKVAVIAEYSPPLACSTIPKGRTREGLWSDIGVIINKGRVDQARIGGLGSRATSLNSREAGGKASTVREYQAHLNTITITKWGHNEVIVGRNPQIAGLFLNLDSTWIKEKVINSEYKVTDPEHEVLVSLGQVYSFAKKLGATVFVFRRGIAYESSLDSNTGKLIIGKEVSPRDMLQRSISTPEENKARLSEQAKRSLKPAALI